MNLILNILSKSKASWLIYNQGQVKFEHNFDMQVGEENVLFNLDKFLRKNRLDLPKVTGFGLIVGESSLTQVKVVTTIINTLGWNFNQPTAGIFYDKSENILEKLVKEIKKNKKFKPIKVKYERQPEITISKKKNKFRIIK